ncbi:MAG TPA: type II secretion system protein [Syntrophomonadaceae bacterium]|nr:type II secretion system protein [Syntrophomonadaceae bacterium]HPR94623.1 type II secretion system protein [Syntrophomonadaceae bacterium]
MSKRFASLHSNDNGERGFTLVEILTAMVILLIIVTACFPLFTLATKITHDNKARTIATELAARQLEQTLAQVTSSNYINDGDDPVTAPLNPGVSAIFYFDDAGNRIAERDANSRYARFEGRKIVEWVDDPADGLLSDNTNIDNMPFDYKRLIIEVSSPSLFTGAVTKQANFDTFVAREGSDSPLAGVMIEVVRGWTDEDGNRVPLEGVTVTLEGDSTSESAVTNAYGQALFPINFPNDNTAYSFSVQTECSGMIPRPDQIAGVAVEARPYSTSFVQVEMEEPAALTLSFAPSLSDVVITLDGGAIMGGTKNVTLTAGDSSVTFNNLWPAGIGSEGSTCEGGTYTLNISPLMIYSALPDAGVFSPDVDNAWSYQENYTTDTLTAPAWVALNTQFQAGDTGSHRLSLDGPIDITPFQPASANITAALAASFSEFSLSDYNELSTDFPLVYLGEENAELNIDSDWEPLILANQLNSGYLEDEITINNDYLSKMFKLRFDTNPDIGTFYFRTFNIRCSYSIGNIQFTEPGENLTIKVSGD